MGVICQILLKKTEEGVHRAGQPVTGTVKYAIDKPTEYKEIALSLIGKGECSWSKTESSSDDNNSSKTTTYTGHDNYVNHKINLLQKPTGAIVLVPAGSYEYPFEFILPKDIPPSFKDATCKITYEVVLELTKPRLINSTKKFNAELNVYGYVNPLLASPIIFGAEKSLFKPFSPRRNIINLKVELAKTVLIPGENANLNYVITNQSTVGVNGVRIDLLTKTKYTADCGETSFYSKVFKDCTVRQSGCASDSIAKGTAIVPILAELYTIQHTKIISKEYFIRVTLELPMPHINESAEVQVVIGEIDRGDDMPPPYSVDNHIKVSD